jgi:hypothetical protein
MSPGLPLLEWRTYGSNVSRPPHWWIPLVSCFAKPDEI